MSLLHPTTGDIVDRILVLRLKLKHAKTGAKTDHLKSELSELDALTERKYFPAGLTLQLADLHEKIWEGVDQVMAHPVATWANAYMLARVAINLQQWNLERSRLKAAIDKQTGEYKGDEKV